MCVCVCVCVCVSVCDCVCVRACLLLYTDANNTMFVVEER